MNTDTSWPRWYGTGLVIGRPGFDPRLGEFTRMFHKRVVTTSLRTRDRVTEEWSTRAPQGTSQPEASTSFLKKRNVAIFRALPD